MKKYLLALGLAVSTSVALANGVSVDTEWVKDSKTDAKSQATYVRAGTSMAGMNVGLQARTQVWDRGGMVNSLEGSVGRSMGPLNVFAGVGHDNGLNGGVNKSFQYGFVGAGLTVPMGPIAAFTGVKTRLNWEDTAPDQTVAFVGVGYNLNKKLSVNLSVSRSYQDIKEEAVGLGLKLHF